MELKTLILFLTSCFFLSSTVRELDVNYQHKSLCKILEKAGIESFQNVNELPISDSVAAYIPLLGKFFEINIQNKKDYKYIYVGRINSCRAGGCSAPIDDSQDLTSEYFDYFILFDKAKVVRALRVFNYQASHGHEVSSKGWLHQFVGYDGSENLEVEKNVDAISGATISVYAITEDITSKTKLLHRAE